MTIPMTETGTHLRLLLRSSAAVLLGFVAVVVLSLGTDQVLHMLGVYPPWGQPMYNPGLNLLALAYRIVYTVLGGYIAARLAPHNPMRHALALGIVGLAMGAAGAIATIPMHPGPSLVPDRARPHRVALLLARRSSIPRKAGSRRARLVDLMERSYPVTRSQSLLPTFWTPFAQSGQVPCEIFEAGQVVHWQEVIDVRESCLNPAGERLVFG